jgi:hypothetical protein
VRSYKGGDKEESIKRGMNAKSDWNKGREKKKTTLVQNGRERGD